MLIIGRKNEYPTFGDLKNIYVMGDVLFDVLVYETKEYSFHFHGYIISKTNEHKLVTPTDLVDHVPLHNVYVRSRNNLVVMKYHIYNTIWH